MEKAKKDICLETEEIVKDYKLIVRRVHRFLWPSLKEIIQEHNAAGFLKKQCKKCSQSEDFADWVCTCCFAFSQAKPVRNFNSCGRQFNSGPRMICNVQGMMLSCK